MKAQNQTAIAMAFASTQARSMLTKMEASSIFGIEREGDGFYIEELCDHCYATQLTQDELRQLGQEIIDLAEGRYHG